MSFEGGMGVNVKETRFLSSFFLYTLTSHFNNKCKFAASEPGEKCVVFKAAAKKQSKKSKNATEVQICQRQEKHEESDKAEILNV